MSAKETDDVFFQGLGGVLQDAPHSEDIEAENEKIDLIEASEDDGIDKVAQQEARPVTKNNLFSHPEAHPFVLDMALLKAFQLDWFGWDSDTLFQEISETFNTSIADVNKVKILACTTLHVVDSFWEQWEVFENTILALNGIIPRIGYMQPPDVPLLMTGVDIANSVRKEDFSDEVSRYTAACFLHEHVSYCPDPLEYAQLYVTMPKYKCAHCGQTGSALPPFNGRCDSCSRKFEDHPFNFKPADDAKDKPEDVSYELTYDPDPTRVRYEELLATPPDKVQIDETADDIEAARLIIATDYMNFRRRQRDKQLSQIKDWMASS